MKKVCVITGPSGSGKTVVIKGLIDKNPIFEKVIATTTRPCRKEQGEKEGKDFFFVDLPTFVEKINKGEFFENSLVYGEFYGATNEEVIKVLNKTHQKAILSVDVQGAKKIRANKTIASNIIFISAPLSELPQRIANRGKMSPEELSKRMNEAKEEFVFASNCDHVVENRNGMLSWTIDKVEELFLQG